MLTITFALALLILQCSLEGAGSVRVRAVEAPAAAAAGGSAALRCRFSLGDHDLYSVKWYKDGREFRRYLPRHLARRIPAPYSHFHTPGFTVDVARSSVDRVVLANLTLQATGAYRCEVSGEAPLFASDSAVAFLTVVAVPEGPPEVTGLRPRYKIGERLSARCTVHDTQTDIHLQWLLNGEPVDKLYHKGPFKRISPTNYNVTDTIIQLSFLLLNYDFIDGKLSVKCVSSIPPVYESQTTEIVELLSEENVIDFDEEADEGRLHSTDTHAFLPNKGDTTGYTTNIISIILFILSLGKLFSL